MLVKLIETLIQIKCIHTRYGTFKTCGDIINKALESVFKQALIRSKFLSDWKKDNIVSAQ